MVSTQQIKEVRDLPVPTQGWTNGGWNGKLPQLMRLAKMLGHTGSSVSSDDLQVLFRKAASAKVFGENVQAFLDAAGLSQQEVASLLMDLESDLGLMAPVPFMSLEDGLADPSAFDGVVLWPTGTVNWTDLRLDQIELVVKAGARVRRIIAVNSTRTCNSPADRRHPLIRDIAAGDEPTEGALQRKLAAASFINNDAFAFPYLPALNDVSKPLTLEQQLKYLIISGQFEDLVGDADLYVPATPNSLFVPLHAASVLGRDNVWFSQAGATLMTSMPSYWWPTNQDVMTTPNGAIRLWIELARRGCITTS